jgi:DNA-directed RNA polymerase II subunit RPB1
MQKASIPYTEIESITFSVSGDNSNRSKGVVEINTKEAYVGGTPKEHGVYSANLGTTSIDIKCSTCHNTKEFCPGHFGYILLKSPVLHPSYIKKVLVKWLKLVCFDCGEPLADPKVVANLPKKKRLTDLSKLVKEGAICPTAGCGKVKTLVYKDKEDHVSILQNSLKGKNYTAEYLAPSQIKEIVERIKDQLVTELGFPMSSHPRNMVISTLIIPPTTIRPDVQKLGGGKSNSDDITTLYRHLVDLNDSLPINPDPEQKKCDIQNLNMIYYKLCKGTNTDTSFNSKRDIGFGKTGNVQSITQRIKGKKGRIRNNILGKRIPFTARNVITGDPFIPVDGLRIPIQFATHLTVPDTFQDYNRELLLRYYYNGPDKYPGSEKIFIKSDNCFKSVSIVRDKGYVPRNGDIIYRHIIDGDTIYHNRQPSLLSRTMGCHRAIVSHLPAMALNPQACENYHADFDGDTTLIIVPQSTFTAIEARQSNGLENWFINQKDSSTTMGLHHDALLGIFEMTRSGLVFTRDEVSQLLSRNRLSEIPHQKTFTGREVISLLLPNINYTNTPQFYNENLAPYINYDPDEIKLVIRKGVVEQGIMDKKNVGQGRLGGLFRAIYDKYGGSFTLDLIHELELLCLNYFNLYGYGVHVGNYLLPKEDLLKIKEIEENMEEESRIITRSLNSGTLIPPVGDTTEDFYEQMQLNTLSMPNEYIQILARSADIHNDGLFKLMASGTKGKEDYLIHVKVSIGQTKISHQRMSHKFGHKRAMPYYPRFSDDPQAEGYIKNCYITGLEIQEYIAGTMAGRVDLISKALNTSITGDWNRKTVMSLQSDIINCLRFVSKGHKILQLSFGDDNMDTRSLKFIKFPTAKMNNKAMEETYHTKNAKIQKLLDDEFKTILEDRQFYRDAHLHFEQSIDKPIFDEKSYVPIDVKQIMDDVSVEYGDKSNKLDIPKALQQIKDFIEKFPYLLLNEIQEEKGGYIPDYMKSSIKMIIVLIRSYLNIATLTSYNFNNDMIDIVINEIKYRYKNSLVQYGMPVGIVAAQSIIEELTQMMLDSHHSSFATKSNKMQLEKLSEVLGARSTEKMKSTSMTIFLKDEYKYNKEIADRVANKIEMFDFRRFVIDWQIFYENINNIVHPNFIKENDLNKEFIKYSPIKPKDDLTNWCLRFNLDKPTLIINYVSVKDISQKLHTYLKGQCYITYSGENNAETILRIYLMPQAVSKIKNQISGILDLAQRLLDVIIKGIYGITVASVDSIPRSIINEEGAIEQKKEYAIFTRGINIFEVVQVEEVNSNKIQCDSVSEMNKFFGIGLARYKIIEEIQTIIKNKDYRHYSIIADEMTSNGNITSIERNGMGVREPGSVLLRMCNASPIQIIEDACLYGIKNKVSGVAPYLLIGQPPKLGTLYNELVLDEEYVASNVKSLDDQLDEL